MFPHCFLFFEETVFLQNGNSEICWLKRENTEETSSKSEEAFSKVRKQRGSNEEASSKVRK